MTQHHTYPSVEDAKYFFLYQDSDKVAESWATMIQADPDDVVIEIEWGLTHGGDMTGGDIYFGAPPAGRYLTKTEHIELAVFMGWEEWQEPSWPPYRMY
jgi:hypothetical protein